MRFSTFPKAITVIVCLACCLNSEAQHSTRNFDLGQYKLPDLRRHVLYVDFDLDGSAYSRNTLSQNQIMGWENSSNRNNVGFTGHIAPLYTFYRNSARLQMTQSFSVGSRFADLDRETEIRDNNGISLDTYEESFQRQFYHYTDVNYSGSYREFLKGMFFLEQRLDLYSIYAFTRIFNSDIDSAGITVQDQSYMEKTRYVAPELDILAGWGRIEHVEDARLAMYILEDLNKSALLAREVEEEDVLALAEVISRLQNERFFDARHKRIWEMRELDLTMQAMGLVENTDVVYYTLMQDNWDYAALPVRESGFQIAAGLFTGNRFRWRNTAEEFNYYELDSMQSINNRYHYSDIEYGGLIRVIWEKPLDLFWQASVRNDIRGYKGHYLDVSEITGQDENRTENEDFTVREELYMGLGYFPNSRTSINFYSDNTLELDFQQTSFGETAYLTLLTSLGTSVDYYFSPQLRFRASANLSERFYKRLRSESNPDYEYRSNIVNGAFSAGFTYFFL